VMTRHREERAGQEAASRQATETAVKAADANG
jgi:hypothetical protein